MGLTKGWLACFPSTAQAPQNDLSVLQKNMNRGPKLVQSMLLRPAKLEISMAGDTRWMVAIISVRLCPRKLANESRVVCQAPSCVNTKMCPHKQCPHIRECVWRHVDKVRGIQGGWGGCRQAA